MTTGSRGWILWVSLAIMCADSLVSLLPVIAETFYKKVWRRTITLPSDDGDEDDNEVEPLERLVPMRWVAWGLGGSVVFGTILVWAVFGGEGIKPWATVIGFVMGGLLSILGYVSATIGFSMAWSLTMRPQCARSWGDGSEPCQRPR